jgi:hypothetical protein
MTTKDRGLSPNASRLAEALSRWNYTLPPDTLWRGRHGKTIHIIAPGHSVSIPANPPVSEEQVRRAQEHFEETGKLVSLKGVGLKSQLRSRQGDGRNHDHT